ncbi:helix-turn-helix domain-containing protein [Pseudoxanthomonas koreensis]|uniref:helix-turn-helix domain-containing protein n=1 Tax=Pseudoxanthomonas koreensis TaxID=266061 RepID=UPI001391E460|nr:transcriptional regulator [Pseudoxanthomonas koreensis]KAF1696564.1 transcriptional regulator [Pseudoxanthomonas koreensis]
MTLRPIRTEKDYQEALQAASYFFDHEPEPGTAEGDEFDILVTLIESYEARRHPIGPPDPIEAIKFRMEQAGLTAKDLIPSIGQRNRVYEILNGRRELTIPMIRNLHRNLGIPVESLIGA